MKEKSLSIIEFPILYHKTSKGAITTWKVWAEGKYVHTQWGQINGKIQESCVEAEPKNVGRSNETTAQVQAIIEAQSLWDFKYNRKYYASLKEAEEEALFLPMLASSFEKRKRFLSSEEDYPADLQPKLDGLRSLSHWDKENKVKLISRAGKEYLLPHITEEISNVLPKNYILDGELYLHGTPLQKLNTLVRRTKNTNPESIKVEYHVYDLINKDNTKLSWKERSKLLEKFFSENKMEKVVPVRQETVYCAEEVYELQSEFLYEGFEGAVLRLLDGEYKFGYRSKSLLKVKSFQDEEFEIVDFANGKGKFKTCIIYKCITKEGKKFDVVPKGTFKQREQWLKEGENHIGKLLKVQFADWTTDNLPQFPVGVCLRLEEDM